MLKNVWMTLPALVAVLLLSGCEGIRKSREAPRLVLPELKQYSGEFQARLADELDTLESQDCPRDFVIPNCSAVGTFTLDHIHLRDMIRSAGKENKNSP